MCCLLKVKFSSKRFPNNAGPDINDFGILYCFFFFNEKHNYVFASVQITHVNRFYWHITLSIKLNVVILTVSKRKLGT